MTIAGLAAACRISYANFILKRCLLIVCLCLSIAHAIEMGVLNVFTDLPEAIIVVDGLVCGKEAVVKLPLEVGEHYVEVELDGKKVYAEKVQIAANRSATVVSDHFVDIITKTPSRGAIDREASRLRESRGDFGFGLMAQSQKQPAAAIRWWFLKHVGIQGYGLGSIPGTEYAGLVGARLLFSPADKIYGQDILTGYMAVGQGRSFNQSGSSLSSESYAEFALGVEAKIGDLVGSLFKMKYAAEARQPHYTYKRKIKRINPSTGREEEIEEVVESKSDDDFLRDVLIVGLTSIFYTNAEVGIQYYPERTTRPVETNLLLGFYVYF